MFNGKKIKKLARRLFGYRGFNCHNLYSGEGLLGEFETRIYDLEDENETLKNDMRKLKALVHQLEGFVGERTSN